MKRKSEREQLLEDVLSDAGVPGRAPIELDQLLQLARRRRQVRLFKRAGGTVMVVAAILFVVPSLVTKRNPGAELAHEPIQPPALKIVTSTPLLAEQIVTSRPLAPEMIVQSREAFKLIQTASGIATVDDDQLLELAKPNIVALVRRGPHEVELVFVDPPAPN